MKVRVNDPMLLVSTLVTVQSWVSVVKQGLPATLIPATLSPLSNSLAGLFIVSPFSECYPLITQCLYHVKRFLPLLFTGPLDCL